MLCGLYSPGRMCIKSLIGLRDTLQERASCLDLVCCSIEEWSQTNNICNRTFRRLLLCSYHAEMLRRKDDDVHPRRFGRNASHWEVNSVPPSDASSSGMPYAANVRRKLTIRPLAPPTVFSMISQLEYMSGMQI